MYRDLLVHVDGSQSGRARVQFAADLATRTGAWVTGLHVTPPADVPPVLKASGVPELAAELSSDLTLDAHLATAIFNEEAARLPGAVWCETEGEVVQGISDSARYADLIILGQYESQGPAVRHPLPVAHSVVLQCGRPVLVVPAAVRQSSLERIAIAWDGSREAVRAVHDALPLLRLSQLIQIVTINSGPTPIDDADERRLLAHLHNHGVRAATDILRLRSVDEHRSLREQIDRGLYDLLVMGGYSHPMWLEFIFGGATRSILTSSIIPVLVSH